MSLDCDTLLIGVTGSVGAVGLPEYIYQFKQHFAQHVYVLMSRAAQQFITPYTLQLFSGHAVFTDSFAMAEDIRAPHIELAQKASLFLILPTTANILAKAAAGICDDLLSTTIVACQAPIVFVPNMNQAMWSDRIVQRNVRILQEVGYYVIEPGEGVEVVGLRTGGGAMPPFDSLLISLKMVMAASNA